MNLRESFLLLSLILGDVPTILAAAQAYGFMPTKVDKGSTAGLHVDPAKLFDIVYRIYEESSKLLKELRKEPERTTSQPDAELTSISPNEYNLTRSNINTDKYAFPPAEKQSNIVNNSPEGRENGYDTSYQYASSKSNVDDYGDRGSEDIIGYAQCNEESGAINCKYVSEKKVSPAESPTSLADSNVHQHNNSDSTVQYGTAANVIANISVSGNNKKAGNATNILRNITTIFGTTENPVLDKAAEVTTEPSEVSEEQFPALKGFTSVSYEYLLESSKTDSRHISDNSFRYPPYIPYQDYQKPLWDSYDHARNMCIWCGPNAYCDNTQDPNICVCYFGHRGFPPNCYKPSGDELLRSYRKLLKRHSNEKVSSTNSPVTVKNKEQCPKFVLQENKDSVFPKV